MKKITLFWMLIFLALLLAGCGAGEPAGQSALSGRGAVEVADSNQAYKEASSANSARPKEPGNAAEQKIIKNAEVTVKADDPARVLQQAEAKASQLGGFVAEANQWQTGDGFRVMVSLRLPADKFETFLHDLAAWGKVEDQRISRQDVTEEYIDLSARLENLNLQEQRLREILKQASTVEEILKVENELERVRGERDSLAGRLKYLDNQVELSTINIELYQDPALTAVDVRGWDNIGSRSKQALVNSWHAVLNFLAGLVVFLAGALPVLLIIAPLAVAWWFRRRKQGPQA